MEDTSFTKCVYTYRDISVNVNNVNRFKRDVLKKFYCKILKKMKIDYSGKHSERNIKVC